MRLLFPFAALALFLLGSCTPPVRTIPRKVNSGLDSTHYAGVIPENAAQPDLRSSRLLAEVKVKDRGWSLDCGYEEVLALAKAQTRAMGGNLLVVTEHKLPDTERSRCHRLTGSAYRVERLAGLEPLIYWHPERRLEKADLSGRPGGAWPEVHCQINAKLLGDFFKYATVYTETLFDASQTGLPDGPEDAATLAVRRAQLHFDLAEWHSRQLKKAFRELGRDIKAITSQKNELIQKSRQSLKDETEKLDAELSRAKKADEVLRRWDDEVRSRLNASKELAVDLTIDLRKPGRD